MVKQSNKETKSIANEKIKTVKKNPWIDHVRSVAQSKKINLKTAMMKGQKEYQKQKKLATKVVEKPKLNVTNQKINKQL
jgi:hypothetical protein